MPAFHALPVASVPNRSLHAEPAAAAPSLSLVVSAARPRPLLSVHGQRERWVFAMAEGDERALRLLHAACRRKVLDCVTGVVRRAETADELVSATFLQAWADAARFDAARGSALAWLLTIARSRALDALRRLAARERHECSIDDDALEQVTDDRQPGPAGACERARERARLRLVLASLIPTQRLAISMAYDHGLSHEEIAVHCRLPLGTVKSQIKRGLQVLRVRCVAAGIEP